MKKVIGICLVFFMLVGLLSCAHKVVKEDTGVPGAIPEVKYTEAEMYMGKLVSVCGKVRGTKVYPDYGVSVISVGTPSETPGGFHVAIQDTIVDKFPKDLYINKDICITGVIEENPFGGATTQLNDPSQITER